MTDYTDDIHNERRALRSDLLDALNTEDYPSRDSKARGARALEIALEEWSQNIVEPKGRVKKHRILDYINEGLKWARYGKSYQNRKFAWCGAFMAFCWRDMLSEKVRYYDCASTYRLQEWAKGTSRVISSLKDAQAGDIIVVGKGKAWGDHITLFERVDEGGYWSVEGNAWGEVPEGGKRKEGVIRRWRAESEIHAIYRPIEADYAG